MLRAVLVSFVFLVIAIALLGSTADSIFDTTTAKTVTNETITLQINTPVALANNQLDSFTKFYNGSAGTTSIVDTSNYSVDLDTGEVTLLDNVTYGTGTGWQATYVYREVGNTSARTLISLITIFFAIGVFLMFLGLYSDTFRDLIGMR